MREPANGHLRTTTAGRPATLPGKPGRFCVYRADEIRTSSMLFAGGDWHWQLSDAAGLTVVEAGGYRSEEACREAVAMLQRHVPLALISARG